MNPDQYLARSRECLYAADGREYCGVDGYGVHVILGKKTWEIQRGTQGMQQPQKNLVIETFQQKQPRCPGDKRGTLGSAQACKDHCDCASLRCRVYNVDGYRRCD
jgi:hypothetical protein